MITKQDVVTAYTLLLSREPENNEVISFWINRCESTDELVRGIIGSSEFSARSPMSIKRPMSAPASAVKPNARLIDWLTNLESIQGWLSPGAGFKSAALAHLQVAKGYRGNIAEIGVYHGKYLTGLATALQPGEKAIAIDVFEDQTQNADLVGYDEVGSTGIHSLTEQALLTNMQRYCPEADLTTIKNSSLDVKPADILAHGDKIRFFSIDGGHTRDVLLNDLYLAEATLAPHGIISIDDILNAQWPGIITGTVRFFDGATKLRPVAFISNKLLCAFESHADEYRKELLDIAPTAIQRRNVEFSNYTCDQYSEGEDWEQFLMGHRALV